MKGIGTLLTGVGLAAALFAVAPSQAEAQMMIARSVIGNGGVNGATGGGLTMSSTLGQPVIGWVTGGGLDLHQGFWTPLPQGVGSVDFETPAVAGALRSFPNPFSTTTTIFYTLPNRSNVRIAVYSSDGQLVRTLHDGLLEAGEQQIMWDGTGTEGERAPAGMYVFTVEGEGNGSQPGFTARGKVLLVR